MSSTPTYFARDVVQYGPLLEERLIDTKQFLTGCEGIVKFVEFLGIAYSPVRSDIAGNVVKVRTKYDENPTKFSTLDALIHTDLKENGGKMAVATEGLLWLKRGLEFMLCFLGLLVDDHEAGRRSESLASLIKQAYEHTLKRHHGFVQKQLFKMLAHAAPYRHSLLEAVAGEGVQTTEQQCVADLNLYLVNFRANVQMLVHLYEECRLETTAAAE